MSAAPKPPVDPAHIQAAVAYVQQHTKATPHIAIVLGSGLGALADSVEDAVVLPYSSIPHMPQTHVEGHRGDLLIGKLGGVQVVMMRGRVHAYEGYSLGQVTFGIRLMGALGARRLIVTNAAGSLNPYYAAGDLMIITDHINMTGLSPLCGPNEPAWGPRFVDMTQAYARSGWLAWQHAARQAEVHVHSGVYVGVAGPSYETPAEVRYMQRLGGDAVGMSTVAEVLVARHQGMEVAGLSVITNAGAGMGAQALSHEEVTVVARQRRAALCELLVHMVKGWH